MAIVLDATGRPREVRWTAHRKAAVVLRLLAGAPVEHTASEIGVNVAVVCRWREQFVAAGTDGLKGQRTNRGGVDDHDGSAAIA